MLLAAGRPGPELGPRTILGYLPGPPLLAVFVRLLPVASIALPLPLPLRLLLED